MEMTDEDIDDKELGFTFGGRKILKRALKALNSMVNKLKINFCIAHTLIHHSLFCVATLVLTVSGLSNNTS